MYLKFRYLENPGPYTEEQRWLVYVLMVNFASDDILPEVYITFPSSEHINSVRILSFGNLSSSTRGNAISRSPLEVVTDIHPQRALLRILPSDSNVIKYTTFDHDNA